MSNGARKFDQGKPPVMTGCFLRFPRAMIEIAKVSALGAEKYDVVLPDSGFLNVENGIARYTDAHGRHLLDRVIKGEWNTETGGNLPKEGRRVRHLAQAAWDILTVLERTLIEEETYGVKDERVSATEAV